MKDYSKIYKRINKALDNLEKDAEIFIKAKKNNSNLEDLEKKVKLFKKLSIENEELVSETINNINRLIKNSKK